MLYVERSNRTENLLAGLADRLAGPRPDPLAPSVIVVQGQGMERWIAQSIARSHGVCANTDFLFPKRLLEGVFELVEDAERGDGSVRRSLPAAVERGWELDSLVWAVARRIDQHASAPELAALDRQLAGLDRGWRLVQLAQQIAARFDDYITYRPDWIARWSRDAGASGAEMLGSDEAWQSWLFRRVLEDLGPRHLAGRAQAFIETIDAFGEDVGFDGAPRAEGTAAPAAAAIGSVFRDAFPNGVEVFAVSTLPPLYLAVLRRLARIVDVRLSVLCPSRQYWADLFEEVRSADSSAPPAQADGGGAVDAPAPVAPSLHTSNSIAALLSGLGRLGADFQATLVDDPRSIETDRFEQPLDASGERDTLLRHLQSALLDLDAHADDAIADLEHGRVVAPDDRSIRVHHCHGPKRELEVVEAELRAAFRRDPTLRPEDVIVMAPQIDELAPTIEAVFGGAGGMHDARAIPYRIADRGMLHRSPVADAFTSLLSLLGGRAGRGEVLDWLAREPVRARLGLDAEGVERLGEWAMRAGIRFGLDEAHREALGLEGLRGHTWAGGIDRLVLGHAMGTTSDIVRGRNPEPLDAFSDPTLLGAIGALERTLSRARRERVEARSASSWAPWLFGLIEETLDLRDDNAHEHTLLRAAIQRVGSTAEQVGFETPIPFEAMCERVQAALDASAPPQGFLAGGVTFCELVPLRAIPFRVIAIVGLSDGHFPRRSPRAGYDLIAIHPRRGDRSRRSDDRYLFLEALLSARDQLILTVPSHDLRDGRDLPPSVVVNELLDVLDVHFVRERGERSEGRGASGVLRDQLVVDHPIHAFSPRYFEADGDPRLLGRDREAFEGAAALRDVQAGGGGPRRFLDVEPDPSPTRAAEAGTVFQLDELTQRVLGSTRVFARDRLRLRLPRPEAAVGDFDPVALDALERHGLGTALLGERRAGASEADLARRLAANVRLPAGEPGRLAARDLMGEVEAVFEVATSRFGGAPAIDQPFTLQWEALGDLGPVTLEGVIRDLSPEGPIQTQFGRLGRRSELSFWIQHLVVCAIAQERAADGPSSVLVARPAGSDGTDRVVRFSKVSHAKEELATLVEWAARVERAPLPFFPRTSRAFAERLAQGDEERAWADAHREWLGGEGGPPIAAELEQDLAYRRVWEGVDPLAPAGRNADALRFDVLAHRFFEAFFEAREVQER